MILKIFDDFDDESLGRKVQLIWSRLNKLTINKITSEEKLTKVVGRYLIKSCNNCADIKSCSNWPVTAIFRFLETVSIFDPSGTNEIAKSSFILIVKCLLYISLAWIAWKTNYHLLVWLILTCLKRSKVLRVNLSNATRRRIPSWSLKSSNSHEHFEETQAESKLLIRLWIEIFQPDPNSTWRLCISVMSSGCRSKIVSPRRGSIISRFLSVSKNYPSCLKNNQQRN